MSVKISEFQIENVKRIRAVEMTPTENGLTIIGGGNNQGKTSVLDSIAWALGGDRFKPSQAMREGSHASPFLKIKLSNGIVVERAGKNSALKVIDPNGNKGGQLLLNEFVESFALNLPKFMEANAKEKANTLLQIIGVGDKLYELEKAETETYNKRHAVGQIAERKKKYAEELPFYSGVPEEPISASELISQQQEILLQNAENQKKRENLAGLQTRRSQLEEQLERLQAELTQVQQDLVIAETDALDLHDRSTEELEKNIREIDDINVKVRSNASRKQAQIEAEEVQAEYGALTKEIEQIRSDKKALLEGANLPLPELSVDQGEIIYKGQKWDNMSGSEQLRVATAIVRAINPNCGFVLVDKLEQMDTKTLTEFGTWLEAEGLQVIATRVSTGDECSVIIEDGYITANGESAPATKTFEAGKF